MRIASIASYVRPTPVCAQPQGVGTIWHASLGQNAEQYFGPATKQYRPSILFSEILDGTGLARGTVSSNLRRLWEAGVVFRQKERVNFDHPNRGLRVFYAVNPDLIDYLRLEARST